MRTCLVACSMIQNEITPFLPQNMEAIWLDKGLHERPQILREELQNTLDALPKDIGTVLLGFGFCGAALDGVHCKQARLVLPLYDDCIAMMLCKKRDVHTMYYTEGWLEEKEIPGSVFGFYKTVEQYGAEEAREIYKILLNGYTHLCLLDTGVYDVEAAFKQLKQQAGILELQARKEKGNTSVFRRLFEKPWAEEEFWVLEKEETFTLEAFLQRRSAKDKGGLVKE